MIHGLLRTAVRLLSDLLDDPNHVQARSDYYAERARKLEHRLRMTEVERDQLAADLYRTRTRLREYQNADGTPV